MSKNKKNTKLPKLLFADSENSADMLFLSGIFVPDPFIAMQVGKKKVAAFNALEIDRAKKTSHFDVIYSLEELYDEAKKVFEKPHVCYPDAILLMAKKLKVTDFQVSMDFPVGVTFALQNRGLGIEVSHCALFPERYIKTEEQAKHIKDANKACAAGFALVEEVLRKSVIKAGKLYYENKPVTSEKLQTLIAIACIQRGAVASNTIVAGGVQACDPHDRGSGVLRANELIIVDIFPRVTKTGYYGDMTRTFLKGTPSEAQRKLVATVREAQKQAIAKIKAGVMGNVVHEGVHEYFEEMGYTTQQTKKGHEGFFHGTGHGLGLDLHEFPRVSSVENEMKAGYVVTIEPGLYYPEIGGCRIEDVVYIQEDKVELLSKYHYNWIIN